MPTKKKKKKWTTGYPKVSQANSAPFGRYELRAVLWGPAIALVGVPFGLLLHQVTHGRSRHRLGRGQRPAAEPPVAGEDGVIGVMEFISFLGKPIFLLFAVGIPVVWFLYRRRGSWRSSSPSPASAVASSTRS